MNSEINIRRVAEKAGVSASAVSRVLNRKTNVSDSMRSKVMKACSELNYRLNPSIQDLIRKGRNGAARNLAYVTVGRDISSPAYVQSLDGIEEASTAFNYNLSLAKLSGRESSVYELPTLLRDNRIDAILLTGDLNEKIVAVLKDCGKPTVILGAYSSSICNDFPRISTDYETTLFNMVRELKNAGKNKIAFLNNAPHSAYSANQAFEAYKEALSDNGIILNQDIVFWKDEHEDSFHYLKDFFSSTLLPFDGIICLNHVCATLASHFIFAHHNLHESQPEVTLATLWPFSHFTLPVPAIYFNFTFKSMAIRGTTLLIDILSGKESLHGQKIELSSELINRNDKFMSLKNGKVIN